MGEEEVYHPGDPGRKEFEDKWMLAGGKLEQLEGEVIRVSNTEVTTVSPFHACCLRYCSHLALGLNKFGASGLMYRGLGKA